MVFESHREASANKAHTEFNMSLSFSLFSFKKRKTNKLIVKNKSDCNK